MLVDYDVKRPDQRLVVTFDFTSFAAMVAPDPVIYELHAEAGPTFNELSNISGLITLEITGGTLGRHYLYGYEALTDNGGSASDTRRLRIRDSSVLATLPEPLSTIPVGALLLGLESILFGDDYLVLT